MKIKKISLTDDTFPERLSTIPQPPKQLFVLGADLSELLARPAVAIVGSRKVTAYGKTVTAQLAGDLARAGVVVISGLALGVDGIAHQAALDAGGLTMAVLPSSLERIHPRTHHQLARQIVEQGGALVSEYPSDAVTYKMNFIERNRLVAGLSNAVIITEAAEKSGTLHTADFALQQGRDVLAVPGNITSPTSAGCNNLLKTGAMPATSADDVLHILGIAPTSLRAQKRSAPSSNNPHEQLLLNMLFQGMQDGGELFAASHLDVAVFNQTLTMLEIRGHIRPLGNNHWTLTG